MQMSFDAHNGNGWLGLKIIFRSKQDRMKKIIFINIESETICPDNIHRL